MYNQSKKKLKQFQENMCIFHLIYNPNIAVKVNLSDSIRVDERRAINLGILNVGKKDSLQLLYRFSVFVYSVYRSILITMCERRLLLNVRWRNTLEKRFDGQTSVKWHFISAKTHTHTFVRINYSMGDCVTALEQAYRAAVFVFACMCAVIPGLHYAL